MKEEKLSEAIKQWCLEVTKCYDEVDVYDFTSSWRDGHAFNCLLHSYNKKLINLQKTSEMSAIERLDQAFTMADKELQVPRLLHPKELHSEHLDTHSVVCYLMMVYLSMISKSSMPEEPEHRHEPAQRMSSGASTSSGQKSVQEAEKPALVEKVKQETENMDVRSRKSSSSSQKSAKNKKAKREEQLVEFEACIEQVLTWLLEAEDELSTLVPKPQSDMATVRAQFSDFELFMSSLTESQDTVGKVLLKGQVLASKSESDEEKETISSKLFLVNNKWENLREEAMKRQTMLQMQIHVLQQRELDTIKRWLDETEAEIHRSQPLASSSRKALEQIEIHDRFQSKIDAFQATIDKMESFVAVVDEDNDESIASLEEALQSVSARWQRVCEWAERRSSRLDGLSDLIDKTDDVFKQLDGWLADREHELAGLKSAQQMDGEDDVARNIKKIHAVEAALEAEHGRFVQLSQLSCDLVGRLSDTNHEAAEDIKKGLDIVTQRWDNLVARIEEYSKTMVKSGKAEIKMLEKPEEVVSEGMSTDTETDEAKNLLVDKLLLHISKLSHDLIPLQQWSETFTISRKPDQVRKMMNTCQEKLVEIKEQEARVNRLQLELEHLHHAKLNSRQLKRANDAFENFAKGWARIVTKISESMNVLTGHAHDGEEAAIVAKIEQWIAAVDKVISELALLPLSERLSRIEKLEQQLKVQDKNVSYIEKDFVKKAILKKGLEIASKRLASLRVEDSETPTTSAPTEVALMNELDGKWATVGQLANLETDLKRAERLVEQARSGGMSNDVVEKAETRKAEMEEKKRVTAASKSCLETAEKCLTEAEQRLTKIAASDADIVQIVAELEEEREKLQANSSKRKEAERTAEKMLSMDDEMNDGLVVSIKTSMDKLLTRWLSVEKTIDQQIGRARDELGLFVQKRLREGEDALDEVNKSIEKSKDTSLDAEGAAEHLDQLENSLERISQLLAEIGDVPMDDLSRHRLQKLAKEREDVSKTAAESVKSLSSAVTECELFEKQMSGFQNWSTKMSFLLASRKSMDFSAFDIPHEYQKLAQEIGDWRGKLGEFDGWMSKKDGADGRLQEQLSHAKDTLNDLTKKFNEFKRPKGFEEKLEKLISSLSSVENSLDDMTGIEGAECGSALSEARALLRTVDAAQEELKNLQQAREQLIQDKILDEDTAKETLKKLQFVKGKVKELAERGSNSVERLEDCVEMFKRLKEETDEIELFLDEMEKRLDEYAKGDRPEDEQLVANLISEWNRNEAAMKNAAHLQRMLNERAVKIGDEVLALKRIRADALKNRLNSWSRTLQEMNDDDETALLEIDELHSKLEKDLSGVEHAGPAQIAEKLRFLRADRDRLSSRARKLAAKNPRLAATDVLANLNRKWSELEEKAAAKVDQKLPELELKKVDSAAPFDKKVDALFTQAKDVSKYLNFEASPVASVKAYNDRTEEVEKWLGECRPLLDQLIKEGKAFANNGRMELTVHSAIEKLDEVVNQIEEVEISLDTHKDRLAPLVELDEQLRSDVADFNEVIDAYLGRNLDDVDIAQATRRELAERDAHISTLSQRATSIHCGLPGRGPQQHDGSLDQLRKKLEHLETLLARVKPVDQKLEVEPEKSSPDRTSRSSIGPFAMEAHGTATEDEAEFAVQNVVEMTSTEDVPMIRKVIAPGQSSLESDGSPEILNVVKTVTVAQKIPEAKKETEDESDSTVDEVALMFELLDTIEDSQTNVDEFPFDYLDTIEQDVEEMLKNLERCEKVLKDNAMTINIAQSDSARERIEMLRNTCAKQKERFPKIIEEWLELDKKAKKAEKSVEECEKLAEEMEENMNGEHIQVVLPDFRTKRSKAEQDVCETMKTMSLILPRMEESSEKADGLRGRVYAIEDRFRALAPAEKAAEEVLERETVSKKQLDKWMRSTLKWCARSAKETAEEQRVNVLDAEGLETQTMRVEELYAKLMKSRDELRTMEVAKDYLVANPNTTNEEQHEIRRNFSETAKQLAKLQEELADHRSWTQSASKSSEEFWRDLADLETRSANLRKKVDAIAKAVIYKPSKESVTAAFRDAQLVKDRVANIKQRVQSANLPPATKLSGKCAKKVIQVLTDAASAYADTQNLADLMAESETTTEESKSTVVHTGKSNTSPPSSNDSSQLLDKESTSADSETTPIQEDEDDEEETEDEQIHQKMFVKESTTATTTLERPEAKKADANLAQQLVQTRHWLHDLERDASATVDLAEWQPAKQLWQTIQGILDEIRLKSVLVTGMHDASASKPVRQQAVQLLNEMRSVVEACDRRCLILNRIADAARQNETARGEMELWLSESQEAIGEKRSEEITEEAVRFELRQLDEIIQHLPDRKQKMQMINSQANAMLDSFTKDEAHNLSHLLSRINMSWTKFNDNIRIRRAVLEASLRSRGDFHSALAEFEAWVQREENECGELDELTANSQAIKDTGKRKAWTQQYKALNAELTAHEEVLKSVVEMGKLLVDGLENGSEKTSLQARVGDVSRRWAVLRETVTEIGGRVEKAEQEWEKLSDTLADLLSWLDGKRKKLMEQQPIGGNLTVVMQQSSFVKNLQREMELKAQLYKKTVSEAHSFLMQHDLRPKIHSPAVLEFEEEDELADMEDRRRGLEIHANNELLKKQWAELGAESEDWDKNVQKAMQRLQELERNLAECQLHLTSSENELEQLELVEELKLEQLKTAREETQLVGKRVDELRLFVDDVNDAAARLLADDLSLDQHVRQHIENVNKRFTDLKAAVRIRQAAIKNAVDHFGPSSEHFLNQSVALPWQRAISKSNQLPYYINQKTEKTQWEHPVWVEIFKELSQFNRVKFIAYRTAMKLRALQKRLCLDLVDGPLLEKVFGRLKGLSAEECPGLEGMVCALLPLFETLHLEHPQQVQSVSLAVDVCINFLLNLFDQARDGILRVLSFKIALIIFSNITLEEKYNHLFNLVAQEGEATQKQVALLLYDLIHIPRLVGESAAFGGSNVEPSVRSCFETVKLAPTINEAGFLEWARKEPQSIVWLAVMHRLAASENVKHPSKCNVCKMFPIVGLRYRCLSCFNLDLCQNCFFSQRTAKRHKLKHPMQEYSSRTSSTDDARDFALMIKNKLRSSRRQLAYLPVDVAEEGAPLASPPAKVHNQLTEQLNADTATMAAQLAKVCTQQPALPAANTANGVGEQFETAVQSPLQIINQVEQMQRDELDQMLHRLQVENQQLRKQLEFKKNASTSDISRVSKRHDRQRSESRFGGTLPLRNGRSVVSLKSTQSQNDVMDEAKALRMHKQRLEHRSRILEQQNEQLELQLQRLKKVIDMQKEGTSVPVEEQRQDMLLQQQQQQQQVPSTNGHRSDEDQIPNTSLHMHSLMNAADDIGRAMESLVVSVVYDSEDED